MTKIYKCFIASPGDTINERAICEKVFNDINNTVGKANSFRIESLTWEKDSNPAFGEYSQKIISEQLGNDYDLFIGIMYKKFGTPTKNALSGTEEEFNLAYERLKKGDDVEIMFYFNNQASNLSEIDLEQLTKVNSFRKKLEGYGGYYWTYDGLTNFENYVRNHVTNFFLKKKAIQKTNELSFSVKENLEKKFKSSLSNFNSQPLLWIEPVLVKRDRFSKNPDENFQNRIEIDTLIESRTSKIIKSPPQFGLTCLANYLILKAWENNKIWIYIDLALTKPHQIKKKIKEYTDNLGLDSPKISAYIVDSFTLKDSSSLKKIKILDKIADGTPIIVMQTINDQNFIEEINQTEEKKPSFSRDFEVLHLLALSQNQIREVVSKYNEEKDIGDENIILKKVVNDLEVLNIHRTPFNCITLLKVSENYFDESPINRTKFLEQVLSVLFRYEALPTYKNIPDLKDCEYILGKFCEDLIRNDQFSFEKTHFIHDLGKFCKEKLIEVDVRLVFDVLFDNTIIIENDDSNYIFRSSFWIYYFGAKRMHFDNKFATYIFKEKKYISFPPIIEFYTGIDRNRQNAIELLYSDLDFTCNVVKSKVAIPDNINPYEYVNWTPSQESITAMSAEINETIINSGLPEDIKDQHADANYNLMTPYDQSLKLFFEEYSLFNLQQIIKASSGALRNSDYVNPEIKLKMFRKITDSWLQFSKVLFALTPIIAKNGNAKFGGINFVIDQSKRQHSFSEKLEGIFLENTENIIRVVKDDISSKKMGPLFYKVFGEEKNKLKKFQLAMLIVNERPNKWNLHIDNYIVSLNKNSFFLARIVTALKYCYKFEIASDNDLRIMKALIKKGLAKHVFGGDNPGVKKINKINDLDIPERKI